MYLFKKGSDVAQIDNNKVRLDLSIHVREVDGTHLIEIPSLDIHSYTTDKHKIDQRIDESLLSFFKYWLKVAGKEELIDHMLTLGFNLSSPSESSLSGLSSQPKRMLRGSGTVKTLQEELVIA